VVLRNSTIHVYRSASENERVAVQGNRNPLHAKISLGQAAIGELVHSETDLEVKTVILIEIKLVKYSTRETTCRVMLLACCQPKR